MADVQISIVLLMQQRDFVKNPKITFRLKASRGTYVVLTIP